MKTHGALRGEEGLLKHKDPPLQLMRTWQNIQHMENTEKHIV